MSTTVESAALLDDDAVASAVAEACYALVS